MLLTSWLEKLETTPHYLTTPAPERIKTILKRLNFKKYFSIITIAGTNGKGTTTHLLANYFHQQGLKIGRFTSPHLLKFNERIAINDIPATDTEIVATFETIKAAQQDLALTYFDYSFLASLLIFKKHNINLACLEVGLGGRLDATNALDTDFAIITTIDLDHKEQLGNTREAIGFEKAQIMRPHIPCVCGDNNPPHTIIDYAQSIAAPLYIRHKDFEVIESKAFWQLKTKNNLFAHMPYPEHIPLQNAATALMSLTLLSPLLNLPLNLDLFKHLLTNLKVPGRMQWVQPQILVDVAHNPESARYLAKKLAAVKVPGKIYALFSALNDKDLPDIIKPLSTIIDTWYIFELKNPRATNINKLQETILQIQNSAKIITVTDLKIFKQQLSKSLTINDRLVVFGSFLLVNEFLAQKLLIP